MERDCPKAPRSCRSCSRYGHNRSQLLTNTQMHSNGNCVASPAQHMPCMQVTRQPCALGNVIQFAEERVLRVVEVPLELARKSKLVVAADETQVAVLLS